MKFATQSDVSRQCICKAQYETVVHGKICPYCQSERTYLIQGNEAQIKEIVVEDESS